MSFSEGISCQSRFTSISLGLKNQLKFIKDQDYEIEMAMIPTIHCDRHNPLDAEMLCVFGLSHNLGARQVVKRPVAANHQGRSGYTDTFFSDNTIDEQATGQRK